MQCIVLYKKYLDINFFKRFSIGKFEPIIKKG